MPLPDARPSEKIARLFPQVDALKDQRKDQQTAVKPADAVAAPGPTAPNPKNAIGAPATQPATAAAQASTTPAAAAKPIPLPEARPDIKPSREMRRSRRFRRYRAR
jgi:membrane-bound lytic murein transglycosylase A